MSQTALSIVRKYYPGVDKIVEANDPVDCAMAHAIRRIADGAIVSKSTAYVIIGHVAERYKVPPSVNKEILSFDRHHDFRPGDYHLRAPSQHEKIRKMRNRGRKERAESDANPSSAKRPYHISEGVRKI